MTIVYDGKRYYVEVACYESHADAFLHSGYDIETGIELTEDELDGLQDMCADQIAKYLMQEAGTWID